MTSHTGPTSLRWGRILLGGFLAELILILLVIPMRLAGSGETPITAVAVGGSFLAFVPVARWLTRSVDRPLLHGVLMGAAAVALYQILAVVGRQLDPTAPPMPFVYYVAHALKLTGGAIGGWLAGRSAAARAGAPAVVAQKQGRQPV